MRKLAIALIAAAAFAVPASAAELVTNGSFEAGTDPGSFTTLSAPSTAITGWTVAANSVDYIGSYWTASNGVRSIDLAGNDAGTLTQTLSTVANALYTVTFDLWANDDNGSYPRNVFVNVGGSDLTFSSPGGGTKAAPAWTSQTFQFTAAGSSTVLSFRADPVSSAAIGNPDFDAFGPAIDNVSVLGAVPEPATWAMMIVGFGFIGAALRRRAKPVLTNISFA